MWPAIMACRKSADKISADIDIAITNYKKHLLTYQIVKVLETSIFGYILEKKNKKYSLNNLNFAYSSISSKKILKNAPSCCDVGSKF